MQQSGLPAFLTSQFALPISVYAQPAVTETNNTLLQQRFFTQVLYAPDQLRQRVAFALGQIFVISGTTITTPQAYTPYLQLLDNDAFTNYRQIMQDVTLSPAMGDYLDMVNNDGPNIQFTGTHADENYARELMQLFTIGLSLVNDDGSFQLDSSGNPIPTYTQNMVEASVLTPTFCWTYLTQPEATLLATILVLDGAHGPLQLEPRYRFLPNCFSTLAWYRADWCLAVRARNKI